MISDDMKKGEKQWLVREEAETNSAYGHNPQERPIKEYVKNGLVIIDKPTGPTSHQVSAWVRDIFKEIGVKKVGHTGTLDPHVTGVLPCLIQNAVKIAPALSRSKKEYVCLMRLHKEVDEGLVRTTAAKFIGKITQVPPRKAAVKKVAREREVYYFEIIEIKGQDVLFRIGTEAGFYVRKLCIDFGKELSIGAHMQELRRTKAGAFTENDAVKLQDVRDAYEWLADEKNESKLRQIVKPLEVGVQNLKKIIVKDSAAGAICYGAPLHIGGIAKLNAGIEENELVAIMSLKGELIALATAKMKSEAILKKRVGVAAEISRVIMPRDVYPKLWGVKG